MARKVATKRKTAKPTTPAQRGTAKPGQKRNNAKAKGGPDFDAPTRIRKFLEKNAPGRAGQAMTDSMIGKGSGRKAKKPPKKK